MSMPASWVLRNCRKQRASRVSVITLLQYFWGLTLHVQKIMETNLLALLCLDKNVLGSIHFLCQRKVIEGSGLDKVVLQLTLLA